jgi:hypothetical protein
VAVAPQKRAPLGGDWLHIRCGPAFSSGTGEIHKRQYCNSEESLMILSEEGMFDANPKRSP